MLRIITRVTDRRIKTQQNIESRFYRSIKRNNKHICKSKSSNIQPDGCNKGDIKSILSVTYNSKKNIISCLYYGNTPKPQVVVEQIPDKQKAISVNSSPNFEKSVKKIYKPSLDALQNSSYKDVGTVSSNTYNNVKIDNTRFFYGSLGQPEETAKQVSRSIKDKGFSNRLKNHIPSLVTLAKNGKKHAGKLSISFNSIKKPVTYIFLGKMLRDQKAKQDSKESDEENVSQPGEQNMGEIADLEKYTGKNCPEYLTEQLNNIRMILENINTTTSKDEKYDSLLKWQDEINKIYCMIKALNNTTSDVVLSQYSKYSENLTELMARISEDEDYSRLIQIFRCVTVISIQLFLLCHLNIPFTDQLASIIFSFWHKIYELKDEPNLQELLDLTLKKVREHLPDSVNTLESVDWMLYFSVMRKTYSLFKLVSRSWKESRMEYPDEKPLD